MTQQDLKTIYGRVHQYCLSAFSFGEPGEIRILSDGNLEAVWHGYDSCWDDKTEEIDPSSLSEDLDKVYQERIKREAEEREQARILQEQRDRERAEREKEQRRLDYLRLKKEFES